MKRKERWRKEKWKRKKNVYLGESCAKVSKNTTREIWKCLLLSYNKKFPENRLVYIALISTVLAEKLRLYAENGDPLGMRSTTKEQLNPCNKVVTILSADTTLRDGASAWQDRNAHNSNSSQRADSRNGCRAGHWNSSESRSTWTSIRHSNLLPSNSNKCNPLTDSAPSSYMKSALQLHHLYVKSAVLHK